MAQFREIKGKAIVLDRADVDTDQIIPKQFLKRIEKTGFGKYLFFDWRYDTDGQLNKDFELNKEGNEGATVLIANENFGCGSSREHAPWALLDYGFKVIIAPSFADIFQQNCLKNGMLPIVLKSEEVAYLLAKGKEQAFYLHIDLENQLVADDDGFSSQFYIEPFWKMMIMNGWDEIEITLQHDKEISDYEQKIEVYV